MKIVPIHVLFCRRMLSIFIRCNSKNAKRYDFVFINTDKLKVDKSEYLMDEALEATGDHAVVRVDVDG